MTENRDTPPPFYPQIFSIPEILWNRMDPIGSFSVLWDKKISAKLWCPLPLLCMKIFDTSIFLKHRRVLLRSFSVLCDKKFRHKIVISPSHAKNFSDNRNFLIHWIVPQQNFSVPWDEKLWYPLFFIKYRNHWWNWCL